MERVIDISVPDIGDFKDVQIVEVLVKDGDIVDAEQGLIVVESDKATMEIPSPIAGLIKEVLLKVGDKVSRGTILAKAQTIAPDRAPSKAEAQSGSAVSGGGDERFDLVVIGGGPGGYSAAYRAADLGLRVAMIERYQALGGVCLNVGCIPSKALLHIATAKEEAERISDKGVRFGSLELDLNALRSFKDKTVKKLTDGLSQMARARDVRIINGVAKFVASNRLAIDLDTGAPQYVEFEKCIIATGSLANKLSVFPQDKRIVTSTGALQVETIPKQMLVVGAGIIGLEMATIYSALGARIDLVERLPSMLAGVDPDAVRIWQSKNAHRFQNIDFNAGVVSATADSNGVSVEIESAKPGRRTYDLILQSAGRVPNSVNLGLEKIGVRCDAKVSLQSIGKCGRICLIFSRSAMSRVTRCSPIRRFTRGMSRQKRLPGSRASLTRRSSRTSPTLILRWPGLASWNMKRPHQAGTLDPRSFRGLPRAERSPRARLMA